ncbi:chemotaxis protein CheB [Lysobacter arvi]|uniref:protein-glutamate methylesterase n=1 Tax=Lysobacter arvi TaxID=3038776 RepID=A0ABU1CGZ6_9GAMM|nr:chemotaxis protein CheB [Lysobacter arvi]MDR0184226.1 chemotaxis protein CheB [Lysobacter arvi]
MTLPADIHRDLIVIGASAGGLRVLLQLASALPDGFPPVLVVQHIGHHVSLLPELLEKAGPNRALHPVSGQKIVPGTFLVAPPDHHMLVGDGEIRLTTGPKENFARPAIDPLFRSAALAYGPRAIGVILSGRLDDGTAGLHAIKSAGGLAVVQDPDDADEPSMPSSALRFVAADRIATSAELAGILQELARQPIVVREQVPEIIRCEHELTIDRRNAMQKLDQIGTRSDIVCPECGGVLWEIDDARPKRFRCHTGHAFSLAALDETQASHADAAIWAALKALHERHRVLLMMLELHEPGDPAFDVWRNEAQRVKHRIDVLRQLADDD